uniref:Ig-like domain-containing protein n=1 Tax=Amphilophus citrinellus TaxID=61819 RepID=A0A3Q0RX63_AMPCI
SNTKKCLRHSASFPCLSESSCLSLQETITAESGQEITLTCRAPINNNKIIVAEWSRAHLETKYVVFYRNGKFAPAKQHPSFKNRVDLQDRQMKDGDVSVILKDVTTADEGTYECHVFMEGDGAAGVVVGLTVLALLVVGVGVVLVIVSVVLVFVVVSVVVGGSGGGGFVIYRKRLKKRVFCCGD